MHEDHDGVAVSHWLCHATPGTIARITAAVSGFAGSHGVLEPSLRRMTGGVTEALVDVFDAESDPVGAGEGTVVDAATDGLCLTVRLRGPGRWPADETLARLSALADRVELGSDERKDSMTVLLEFPSNSAVGRDPGGRPGGPGPRTPAPDRPSPSQTTASSARCCSHPPSGPRRVVDVNFTARGRPRSRSCPARR